MSSNTRYDATDPASIERYAKRLEGHSLREMLSLEDRTVYQTGRGKGNLGDVVERSYFGIHPGNISAPDFQEAHVELKTTPVKLVGKKLKAKERLVLQIINYKNVNSETWEDSSFMAKNSVLLLLFYLWERDAELTDYVFKIARLWSFPDEDMENIRKDWETIVRFIREGRAHHLSERHTLYLAASVKGSKGTDRTSQPNSDELAKPRAFALKTSYMNIVERIAARVNALEDGMG